jgi:hypothetical protein
MDSGVNGREQFSVVRDTQEEAGLGKKSANAKTEKKEQCMQEKHTRRQKRKEGLEWLHDSFLRRKRVAALSFKEI